MLAITQCLSVIVGSAFLAVMLRTQLNLLAGALYQQVTLGSQNRWLKELTAPTSMISGPGKESIVNSHKWRDLQEMSTSTTARMSPALQQAFLNCSHYFVTEGGSSAMSPMLAFVSQRRGSTLREPAILHHLQPLPTSQRKADHLRTWGPLDAGDQLWFEF